MGRILGLVDIHVWLKLLKTFNMINLRVNSRINNYLVLVIFWLSFGGVNAWGAPSEALGYAPKYPAEFHHFDYTSPKARVGGTLRLASPGSFDSFNPFLLKSIPSSYIENLVFETLMTQSLDEPFSAYGLLAEDIDLAADGLSVRFRLNAAARFNDGSPVRAQDVVYTFETLVSTQSHPQYRSYFQDVAKVEALDDHVVEFIFQRRNAELPLILATGMPIFSPRWAGEQEFSLSARVLPIASGPYEITAHKFGSYINYQRRADYWGWGLPTRRHTYSFANIRVNYYFDLNISLEAFKAGETDAYLEYNSKQWAKAFSGKLFDNGSLVRHNIGHSANAGIQGFLFNLRHKFLQDRRVRQAITLAYDFYWANKSLFYGQYKRNDSYFSNSELAARGMPNEAELKYLEPWREVLAPEVFNAKFMLPTYQAPAQLRAGLLRARDLLQEAGWVIKDNQLVNQAGEPLELNFLLTQAGFERVLLPFAHNLKKLGIRLNIRRVDRALYLRRLQDFDYDMIVYGYGASESPGNELFDRFHSRSVAIKGSFNFTGISDPAVDSLIEAVVYSKDRQQLLTTSRALDRVLWAQHLMVPNWFLSSHRLAWNSQLRRPETLPKYYNPILWLMQTWWYQKPE